MKRKPRSSFVRLQIAEDAKTALERQAARHGMSQTELASRVVAWLVRQPSVVQASILNNIETIPAAAVNNLTAKTSGK